MIGMVGPKAADKPLLGRVVRVPKVLMGWTAPDRGIDRAKMRSLLNATSHLGGAVHKSSYHDRVGSCGRTSFRFTALTVKATFWCKSNCAPRRCSAVFRRVARSMTGAGSGSLRDRALLGARAHGKLGHKVRLMPPAYVKPYVKRGKTDVADAEAISRSGGPGRPCALLPLKKTTDQQAVLMLQQESTNFWFVKEPC